ncbi:MAG: hypothetical protein QOJ02_3257 [Acidobacteriota bacterium]|jgi:hypothetical protein|nr:hypothetical protein [Acidobacteriota bacterium]
MEKIKKSKYDTNPLDTDYAQRADQAWGEPRPVEPVTKTEERWDAEAPTKRYDSSIPVSYPSINVPPTYPPKVAGATAQMSPNAVAPSSTRIVPGLGLPENVTLALPYAPFFIGAVAGAVELLLTPRNEIRARSNAAQALVLHLLAVAITTIFNIVGNITGSNVGGKLFWAASTGFFIIAMLRVWKGEEMHFAAADDATRWLNERISPQKTQKQK